jgi:hypothetical protein
VPALAGLLAHPGAEVRVRALMALGMLLPSSGDACRELAGRRDAVQALLVGCGLTSLQPLFVCPLTRARVCVVLCGVGGWMGGWGEGGQGGG